MIELKSMSSMTAWKDVRVSYTFKGKHIEEDLYLTIDLEQNQIVVLKTARLLLASQPGGACNYEKLRADAIYKFESFAKSETKEIAV